MSEGVVTLDVAVSHHPVEQPCSGIASRGRHGRAKGYRTREFHELPRRMAASATAVRAEADAAFSGHTAPESLIRKCDSWRRPVRPLLRDCRRLSLSRRWW